MSLWWLLAACGGSPTLPPMDPAKVCDDDDVRPGCVRFVEGTWVHRYEVDGATYQACVAAGTCTPRTSANDATPAHGLSHEDAVAVCRHLGGQLPTPETWATLASPNGKAYPWGDHPDCDPPSAAHRQRVMAETSRAIAVCGRGVDLERPGAKAFAAMCGAPYDHEPEAVVHALHRYLDEAPLIPVCGTSGPVPVTAPGRVRHPSGLRFMAGNVREWATAPDGTPTLMGGSWLTTDPEAYRADAALPMPADLAVPDAGARCVFDAAAP